MPDKMKAWQFTSAAGGLEKNLFLPASGANKPHINHSQILVEVYAAALNPVDHKIPELGLLAKAMIPSPSIPGMDFCGKVVEAGEKVSSSFKPGQMVFGTTIGLSGHGTLAQYVAVGKENLVELPEKYDVKDAAAAGVTGITAVQALKPNVKPGDKVFVNGGSGGTGIYTIQIAKALGCHVTAACSTANVDLCKSLGADEVLDYKERDIIEQLKEKGQIYSLVVDNIGSPSNLFVASDKFIVPHGKFVQVGMPVSLGAAGQLARNTLLPGFLGGGRRKYQILSSKARADDLEQLAVFMKEGKLRAVIDEVFEFEDVPRAFEKLKTGRAKGKIVVNVKKE
ncbi:GroES-like protein [Aaosphaeria arxii CBS 175.79]|uniref:GroES-like protein n=1 Tax=Aaosphaeria arxii CBS 175.79 TaxID=1450172 RepID=A0A6A5X9V2_9PLEO|nr:GroES-like protein [Aaosphaeria arxii CBS 175.79]KAF2009700.1 GroES-like protein [Aaosphaeria arxii CBS 175.79]